MITICASKDVYSIIAGLQGNLIGFDEIKCAVVKVSPRAVGDKLAEEGILGPAGPDGSTAVKQPIPHYNEPISNPNKAI